MKNSNELGSGIGVLRRAVILFGNCSEGFNQRFSAAELLRLYDAYSRAELDLPPDRWAERQILAALRGVVPEWCSTSPAKTRQGKP